MKNKILVVLLIIIALLMIFLYIGDGAAKSEGNEYDGTVLYVLANQLNGRYAPRKTGIIEALFDKGAPVKATGRWSKDMLWIEVYGGECGTVWCKAEYLSEITDPIIMENSSNGRIKIRSKPGKNGRIVGYVKRDQKITVNQIVLGWGRTKKGWIDLLYFSEVND